MPSLTTALLVAITCYTSGHPQDEAPEPMVYMKIPNKVPETIENTVSRSNAFHPLVRFRAIEVQPVYFFVVRKSPDLEEQKLTAGELVELLSSIYVEEYNEQPPREHSQNIIRFGVIR